MRALVTGATGLIGSHLVKALLEENHEVQALVRPSSDVGAFASSDVAWHYGDIGSLESLIAAADGADLIFHAAGTFSYWGYEAGKFISEATEGMANVIQAAAANRIGRVVFTSSSVTMGAASTPTVGTEDHPGSTEDLPAYVRAKIEQEKTAFATGKELGVEVVAICPALTIGGPDRKLTESNRMIVNYLKDPYKSTWIGGCNLVSVKDVAQAMVTLAIKGKPGERYLASGDNIEWKDVHTKISALCGMPGPWLQAYHTSAYLASAFQELWCHLTQERPSSTRDQAKMVGRYFWYDSAKIKRLGCRFRSAEDALIETLSWLVTSEHIPSSLRASIQLSDKIYEFRKNNPFYIFTK